ncbi:hypothetical protein GEMRC1_014032 [Eukaryota sp. GEM-RC1]
MNRYVIALAAFLLQLCIGTVYSLSIFSSALVKLFGQEWSDVAALAFSIAVSCMGFTCIVSGIIEKQKGPKFTGTVCSVLYLLGHLLAAFSVHIEQKYLFLFSFGLSGIGFGFGYVTPVSSVVQWFPDLRGLSGAFSVIGFGSGPIVSGLIYPTILDNFGIVTNLVSVALVGSLTIFLMCRVIRRPPKDWIPKGMCSKSRAEIKNEVQIPVKKSPKSSSLLESLVRGVVVLLSRCCYF